MTRPLNSSAIELAASLLPQCGDAAEVEPLRRGRNNRTYRIKGPSGQWLLKQYFQAPGGRDRCGSEWSWSTFCWQEGINVIPKPLAYDPGRQICLFEHVEGRHLNVGEVDRSHVAQAASFVAAVNHVRDAESARNLPIAAEACFSIEQHLNCVQGRIDRLCSVPALNDLDHELLAWLDRELTPVWTKIVEQIHSDVAEATRATELTARQRCLSPSDCGFHNALLRPSGELVFFDFEYAGWDDPAKLVCDFFWQQEIPAPRETQSLLLEVLATPDERSELEQRVRLLTLVYGVKWCCLALNEFIAADRTRREFSQSETGRDDRRADQLARAKRILAQVQQIV